MEIRQKVGPLKGTRKPSMGYFPMTPRILPRSSSLEPRKRKTDPVSKSRRVEKKGRWEPSPRNHRSRSYDQDLILVVFLGLLGAHARVGVPFWVVFSWDLILNRRSIRIQNKGSHGKAPVLNGP